MRSYSKVSPFFWTGETGRKLRGDPEAQALGQYLLSCPNSDMIGLYYLPLPTMAHELGWPLKGASKALQRVCEAGFACWDDASDVVWVPNMAGWQILTNWEPLKPNDNRVKGAQKAYDMVPDNCFLDAFFDKYENLIHLSGRRESRVLQAPLKPLRSQEQEQEQEKDQEQEQETKPSVDLKADRRRDILAVFDHYRIVHPRAHLKPTAKMDEWKKINARLDEGSTVEELCKAIDGMHVTPHNLGENGRGTKYLQLELCMRTSGQVLRFIENADEPPKTRALTRYKQPTYRANKKDQALVEAIEGAEQFRGAFEDD